MNSIKDFNDYLKEHKHSEGSNFESCVLNFIDEYCDIADLAYVMKYLSKTYSDKLYYMAQKITELENTFHTGANMENTPDGLSKLYAKLEDEMVLLKSAYKEE